MDLRADALVLGGEFDQKHGVGAEPGFAQHGDEVGLLQVVPFGAEAQQQELVDEAAVLGEVELLDLLHLGVVDLGLVVAKKDFLLFRLKKLDQDAAVILPVVELAGLHLCVVHHRGQLGVLQLGGEGGEVVGGAVQALHQRFLAPGAGLALRPRVEGHQ